MREPLAALLAGRVAAAVVAVLLGWALASTAPSPHGPAAVLLLLCLCQPPGWSREPSVLTGRPGSVSPIERRGP